MGIEEILKLIESIQQTDIHELEVTNGDWKVRISRMKIPMDSSTINGGAVSSMPIAVVTSSPSSGVSGEAAKSAYVEVVSPMVGTFYRTPEPGADPFVNENDTVVPGQTLCIIEAMKLMNEIPSEIKGRIVDILVENAQPVEYGQPLFLLEPV